MAGNSRYALDKVSSDVTDEISKELEEGRKAAVEQVKAIQRETKEEATKILEIGERQAESTKRQILGIAELEMRNMSLRAIDETSSRVFQDALASLANGASEYERSLEKLVEQGVEMIGKEAVVQCNEKDKRAVGSVVKNLNGKKGCKLTLSDKSIDSIGGVVLSSKDMSMRFDNTFEARLERTKPQLRREVATLLGST